MVHRKCKYPNCGRELFGIQLYCSDHSHGRGMTFFRNAYAKLKRAIIYMIGEGF